MMQIPEIIDPETALWIRKAIVDRVNPYAFAVIEDKGLYALSVIEDSSRAISSDVSTRGRIRWRAVNLEPRVRRLSLKVNLTENRLSIAKDCVQDLVSNDIFSVLIAVAEANTKLNLSQKEDCAVPFEIIGEGPCSVTSRPKHACAFVSHFEAILGEGSKGRTSSQTVEKDKKMAEAKSHSNLTDYLTLSLEALKAVPLLGPAVAGPVLRLYDQHKHGEENRKIEAHLQKIGGMNKEILGEILETKDIIQSEQPSSAETLMAVELLVCGINKVANKGEVMVEPPVSGWPLPFSRETFLKELDMLFFENAQLFRRALMLAGCSLNTESQIDQQIYSFVNEIPGNRERSLKAITELASAKPDSEVLNAARFFLGGGQA